MALNTLKCNPLTPLRFKGLTEIIHFYYDHDNNNDHYHYQSLSLFSVIFANENENGEKRENNEFVNEN